MRFLSRGAGYSILFGDEKADIILARREPYSGSSSTDGRRQSLDGHFHSNADVIGVRIVGASPNVKPSGQDRLPGTVNYFSGADPGQWHTGIPTFASLEYRGVYPGVDLLYYSNRDKLEFDFRIASMLMPEVRKVLGYLPVRRTLAFITLIRLSPDTTPIDSAMTMSTTQRTKEFQTTSRDQMGAL